MRTTFEVPGGRHTVEFADGKVRAKVEVEDKALIRENQHLAERRKAPDLSPLGQKGLKASWAFQIPTAVHGILRDRHPDIFAGLRDRDLVTRELAAQKLANLYPQYVTHKPRGFLFTGR